VTSLLFIVGARPNFVKVAPVLAAAQQEGLTCPLLHTGQHYDAALSDRFLEQLDLPDPVAFLGVGSGSHAEQTAGVLVGVERHLREQPADAVLVAGDVNSTMAAALAATKLGVPVIHLEAGLRSGDWSMPEEINRIVTDRVADLLLCPSEDARENLLREGIEPARIDVVGNTMIDTLLTWLPEAQSAGTVEGLGLEARGYVLCTLHRPSLVDDEERLALALEALTEISERLPVVLPLHPRTRARLDAMDASLAEGMLLLGPLDYLDFIALEAAARLVITDSGGVQEESSVLGVPCLTFRSTTERPVTVEQGTNRVVGTHADQLAAIALEVLRRPFPAEPPTISLWDGEAGVRSAQSVATFLRDALQGGGIGTATKGDGR
jgi:UDP-N-acetylglucosamine 2-epimerase (non-hydrolysing)